MRQWTTTLICVLCGIVGLLLSCRPTVTPLAPRYRVERPRPAPVAVAAAPAAPASVSLTTSDGTGLRLRSMDARVVIEDPLAFTELELWFENPRPEQTEGRFEILLPPGAQVTRFAMQIHGQLQEAEIVEKQYARQAYEAFLHAARDPALLERDTGNRFRGRVFPIEAYEDKRIIVSYALPLPDPHEPYRLATRGLPYLDRLAVEALIVDPHRGTQRRMEQRLDYQQPTRDVVIPRAAASAGGIRRGERVVARVSPLAGADPGQARRFDRLTVLFDTSASRALEHDAAVEGLGRLLRALARHSGTAEVEILAFDQQVVPVYDGPLGSIGASPLRALRTRRPLGASDLEAALRSLTRGKRDRVLLVSDGLVSAGTESDAQLRRVLATLAQRGAQRLDVLAVGSVRDDPRLRKLATGPLPRAGVVLDLEDDLERAAERLVIPTMDGLRLDVPGATWWHPRTLDGLQPGDHVLVSAELPEGQPMVVQVTGPVHLEHPIELGETDSPLVDHAWMHGRVENLVDRIASLQDSLESETLRKLAVSLSVRHRIFNDLTAFLVLETEQDYEMFGLDRRALGDILFVSPGGVEVQHRAVHEPPRPPPDPVDSEGEDVDVDEDDREGEHEDVEPEPPPDGRASITGTIRDENTRKPIPGALVILQCACLPGSRETQTNAQGIYLFEGLPAGTYTVQALAGQADASKVVDLSRNARFVASFQVDPEREFKRMIRVSSKRDLRRDDRRERRETRGRGGAAEFKSSKTRSVEPDPAATPLPPPVLPPSPAQPTSPVPTPDTTVETVDNPAFGAVGTPIVQEFIETVEIQNVPGASADSAGISLAGTTGAESRYTVEGANVSSPAFGTMGGSGTYGYNLGPNPARALIELVQVRGKGLSRHRARVGLRDRQRAIERCYFGVLQQGDRVSGRVRVQLRLDRAGKVVAVGKLRKLGLRDVALLRCVDQALRETTFSVEGGAPRVLTTLVFQAGDGPPGWFVREPERKPGADPAPTSGTLAGIDALLAAGRTRDAWAMAWTWREAEPTDVLALVALGRVAEAIGNVELAARAYGSILDLFPSRAEMRRYAAGQLEALDQPALDLAVDAYQKAREQRPDHPSSHRNLAYALLRQGDPRQAFDVLEAGLSRRYPPDRFAGVQRVLREDLGIVGAAWLARFPIDARRVEARLAAQGAALATAPSLRFVLTWETDANDVDLHVADAEGNDAHHRQPTLPGGGELFADVNTGFGPECFAVDGPATGQPYRVWVHYFDRGPMGYGMGKVQVVHHDGEGAVVVQDRPFVIMEDDAMLSLGVVEPVMRVTPDEDRTVPGVAHGRRAAAVRGNGPMPPTIFEQ